MANRLRALHLTADEGDRALPRPFDQSTSVNHNRVAPGTAKRLSRPGRSLCPSTSLGTGGFARRTTAQRQQKQLAALVVEVQVPLARRRNDMAFAALAGASLRQAPEAGRPESPPKVRHDLVDNIQNGQRTRQSFR